MSDDQNLLLAIFTESVANLTYLWNTEFNDPELPEKYDSLPDLYRWQITWE